jgi:hypothetical protein
VAAVIDTQLATRDRRCVGCGTPVPPFAVHHRILGNRADNRLSNRLLLCGTGNVPPGCHGLAHRHARLARDLGYIVSRHRKRTDTLVEPVLFVLDDHGGLEPCPHLTVPPEGIHPHA